MKKIIELLMFILIVIPASPFLALVFFASRHEFIYEDGKIVGITLLKRNFDEEVENETDI